MIKCEEDSRQRSEGCRTTWQFEYHTPVCEHGRAQRCKQLDVAGWWEGRLGQSEASPPWRHHNKLLKTRRCACLQSGSVSVQSSNWVSREPWEVHFILESELLSAGRMDLLYMSDVMAYQTIRNPMYDKYTWDQSAHSKSSTLLVNKLRSIVYTCHRHASLSPFPLPPTSCLLHYFLLELYGSN